MLKKLVVAQFIKKRRFYKNIAKKIDESNVVKCRFFYLQFWWITYILKNLLDKKLKKTLRLNTYLYIQCNVLSLLQAGKNFFAHIPCI